jgi:hypothetical protein
MAHLRAPGAPELLAPFAHLSPAIQKGVLKFAVTLASTLPPRAEDDEDMKGRA